MDQGSSIKLIKVASGVTIGFSLFFLFSHPKSHVKKKLPTARYKNIMLLPNIRYSKNKKVYHFHHWFILSLCYIPLLQSKKLRTSHTFHGLMLGSILQGLLYKDRFTFTYPAQLPS